MAMLTQIINLLHNHSTEIGSLLVLIMTLLRVLSEIFGLIGKWTSNQTDIKIVNFLGKTVDFLGWLIGLFGIGSPKNVSFNKENCDKLRR